MTTTLRRCVGICAFLLIALIFTGILSIGDASVRSSAEAAQETEKTVLEAAKLGVEGADREIPSKKQGIQERITQIQSELDALDEKKESLLETEDIEEEDLRRILVSLGALQNIYSRLTSAHDNLAEAQREKKTREEESTAAVITGQPPFNLSFYEDVRNRYEAVEQRLEAVNSSIRLSEGSVSALQEQIQRMEERNKVLFEELQDVQSASRAKKLFRVKESETDLETAKASRIVQNLNIEAQSIHRALLITERDNLQKALDFVKKHLAYDEKDRTTRIESIAEQIASAREKLAGLREERERARTALTRSQGALTSARNERERVLAQAGASEQQAALQFAQLSLEHTEQTLLFLEEEQRIWNARYSLLDGSLKGQELWDMRSIILTRVKDLESAFLVRQRGVSSIQADILAAQKELEEHAGANAVLARIRSRIDLLNRIAESANASMAQIFSLFNQYSRLREEINEHIDAVRIAERVTTFGKERFLAFWNITLWSGDGFDITVSKLVFAVFLFLAAFFLSGRLTDFLGRTLLIRFGMDTTAMMASRKILFFILMGSFILAALDLVGIPLTAFAFLGGALAIGIGFGAQNIFNNLISGFILMFSEPMRVDDTIEIDGLFATVQEIGTRSTRVKTFDNIDVLMPNSYFLNNKIVNWTLTDQKIRLRINVGVAYGSDARKVEELLLLAANDHTRVLRNPEPFVIFREFGPSALEFTLFFWIDMTNASTLKVSSDLRYRLTSLFEKNGIRIAFPQMDVHLDTRSPVDLRMNRPRSGDTERTHHTQEE